MKKSHLIVALLAMLASATATASAGPLVDLLKARQERIDALFNGQGGDLAAAQRKKLEEELTGALAFRDMAKDALGPEWERRTEAERKAFSEAFEGLLRASLMRKVGIYRVDAVSYADEKVTPPTGSVHTTVRVREATTDVDYSFLKAGAEWRIVDYAVDGVSTVKNYRSQFAKILAKDGWNVLLERIRKRTASVVTESGG